MKKKNQKTEDLVCGECGFPIQPRQKYMKHDKTGVVLCLRCFDNFVAKGKIK